MKWGTQSARTARRIPKWAVFPPKNHPRAVKQHEKITDLTGKEVKLFRAPFGDYSNRLLEVAEGMGLSTIQWDVDSLDWKGISAVELANRVQKAKSGSIILCHNNSEHIVEALPIIFEALKAKGLEFVTVDSLIYYKDFYIDHAGKQILNAPVS